MRCTKGEQVTTQKKVKQLPPATKQVAEDIVTVLRGFSNHMHKRMLFPPAKGEKNKTERLLNLNLWRADVEKLLAKGST